MLLVVCEQFGVNECFVQEIAFLSQSRGQSLEWPFGASQAAQREGAWSMATGVLSSTQTTKGRDFDFASRGRCSYSSRLDQSGVVGHLYQPPEKIDPQQPFWYPITETPVAWLFYDFVSTVPQRRTKVGLFITL